MTAKKTSNIDYYTTAVSLGDLKNGMLYFDHIIPVTLSIDFAKEIASEGGLGDMAGKVIKEVVPKDLLADKIFGERIFLLNMSSYNFMSKLLIKKFDFPQKIEGVSPKQYDSIEEDFANDYLTFVHHFNLGDYPLISLGNSKLASLSEDDDIPTPPILTLSNLKIIDASDSSWEQLLEFRKDPEAKAKLRKLRLFAYENYSDKPKSFIEDDIHTKIYDYENTAKKFGLEMIQATVNNVINSKLFTGVATGSIITTLFAEHPIGLITTSAGAVIELGQLTLEFKKQKYELQNLIKDNPASFITYYRDKHGKS